MDTGHSGGPTAMVTIQEWTVHLPPAAESQVQPMSLVHTYPIWKGFKVMRICLFCFYREKYTLLPVQIFV